MDIVIVTTSSKKIGKISLNSVTEQKLNDNELNSTKKQTYVHIKQEVKDYNYKNILT